MSFFFKSILAIILSINFLLLTGCAVDENVALKERFWNTPPKQAIVVASDKSFKTIFYVNGMAGLVDTLIIDGVMKQFLTYLDQYDLSNLNMLQTEFVTGLRRHKIPAEKYDTGITLKSLKKSAETNYKVYERRDFKPLAVQLKSNQLLLINVKGLGADRQYYSMIPLGAPKAFCSMEARLVDLSNNEILWRFSTIQTVSVEGPWDRPPQYPNFTRALNQAINQAKQAILADFFSSAPKTSKASSGSGP